MPFDLKIAAVARESGRPWVLDNPTWLDSAGLPEYLRPYLREVSDGSYRDQFILITRDELAAWHKATVGQAYDGVPASGDWRKAIEDKVAEVERMLAEGLSLETPFFFMVLWAEWESGLGD